MSMRETWFATALALVLGCGEAHAATLDSISGQILVDRGDGFQPAGKTTSLKTGDRVMAHLGGHARITYADGDIVLIGEDQVPMVTVSDLPSAAITTGLGIGPGAAQTLGEVAFMAGSTAVVGGFVVSAVAANKPVSP